MAILQIKDSNGNWREIVALKGDAGPRGETPEIELEATTLPAGSAATVTKSGTLEHPVFTLGIPKGETPTDVVKTVNNQVPDPSGNVNVNVALTKESVTTALGYTPLSTAGGTVTDTLSFSTPIVINQTTDTSYTTIRGGTSNSDGARLVLTSKGDSDGGQFKLYAHDGTNSPYLVGDPTGYLQWNDENIVRSVNGAKAGNDGDVTIDIPNGVHVGTEAPTDEETSVWVDLDSEAIQPVLKVNGQVPDANGEVTISSVASATKATQDGNGANIADTYMKKSSITYGTTDMTAGTSELATGSIYLMYE